jgi:hypothetical protein
LAFNGHDYQRRDSKRLVLCGLSTGWVCRQRCLSHSTPDVVPQALAEQERAPATFCPHRDPDHPLGYTVTVNLTLPDDSLRPSPLAQDKGLGPRLEGRLPLLGASHRPPQLC